MAKSKLKRSWSGRTHEEMKGAGVAPPKPTEAEKQRAREQDQRFFQDWAREIRKEGR